jgi:hypothetical protein
VRKAPGVVVICQENERFPADDIVGVALRTPGLYGLDTGGEMLPYFRFVGFVGVADESGDRDGRQNGDDRKDDDEFYEGEGVRTFSRGKIFVRAFDR